MEWNSRIDFHYWCVKWNLKSLLNTVSMCESVHSATLHFLYNTDRQRQNLRGKTHFLLVSFAGNFTLSHYFYEHIWFTLFVFCLCLSSLNTHSTVLFTVLTLFFRLIIGRWFYTISRLYTVTRPKLYFHCTENKQHPTQGPELFFNTLYLPLIHLPKQGISNLQNTINMHSKKNILQQ